MSSRITATPNAAPFAGRINPDASTVGNTKKVINKTQEALIILGIFRLAKIGAVRNNPDILIRTSRKTVTSPASNRNGFAGIISLTSHS
jgi:hypothetical protein